MIINVTCLERGPITIETAWVTGVSCNRGPWRDLRPPMGDHYSAPPHVTIEYLERADSGEIMQREIYLGDVTFEEVLLSLLPNASDFIIFQELRTEGAVDTFPDGTTRDASLRMDRLRALRLDQIRHVKEEEWPNFGGVTAIVHMNWKDSGKIVEDTVYTDRSVIEIRRQFGGSLPTYAPSVGAS